MHHHRGLARPTRAETVFPEILPGDTAPQREIRFRPSATVNAADQIPELEKNGSIKITTMSFLNMTQYGDLFVEFMRARREVFIDRLHWTLPQADGMEFDQYDTPQARWVAVHEYGQVLDAGITEDELVTFNYLEMGFGMLEDGLYVLEENLEDPEFRDKMVRFVRASMRGWRYAEENVDEAAAIIMENDETGAQSEAAQARMTARKSLSTLISNMPCLTVRIKRRGV